MVGQSALRCKAPCRTRHLHSASLLCYVKHLRRWAVRRNCIVSSQCNKRRLTSVTPTTCGLCTTLALARPRPVCCKAPSRTRLIRARKLKDVRAYGVTRNLITQAYAPLPIAFSQFFAIPPQFVPMCDKSACIMRQVAIIARHRRASRPISSSPSFRSPATGDS